MKFLKLALQHWAPQVAITRLCHWSANHTLPWLKDLYIKWYCRLYEVNLSEALETDPKQYKSIHDLFTRKLNPAARPIDTSPGAWVSPADGVVSQCGVIQSGELIQAKGKHFTAAALLGDEAVSYQQGLFATIYLSPKDYHRVHIPFSGTLVSTRYIPGKLFSVSPFTADNIDNLFAKNERFVMQFDTEQGPMAVVMVGAMIVGSIVTSFGGQVTPPRTGKIKETYYDSPIHFNKGDELGYFTLGSTVIVLAENEARLSSTACDQPIRFGEPLFLTK